MEKGLFLDRDGVVNREIGRHVLDPSELELLPDIGKFLRKAHELGFRIVIVSNQSGIAKGLQDHAMVERIHQKLLEMLRQEGVEVDDILYAPHHPDHGNSLTRKPASLMLEKALAKHRIDPSRSLMFGDRERDQEAGERAGIRSFLIESNSSLFPYLEELERIE